MRERSTPIVDVSSQPLCVDGETITMSGASVFRRRASSAAAIVRDVKYWFSAKSENFAAAMASR